MVSERARGCTRLAAGCALLCCTGKKDHIQHRHHHTIKGYIVLHPTAESPDEFPLAANMEGPPATLRRCTVCARSQICRISPLVVLFRVWVVLGGGLVLLKSLFSLVPAAAPERCWMMTSRVLLGCSTLYLVVYLVYRHSFGVYQACTRYEMFLTVEIFARKYSSSTININNTTTATSNHLPPLSTDKISSGRLVQTAVSKYFIYYRKCLVIQELICIVPFGGSYSEPKGNSS